MQPARFVVTAVMASVVMFVIGGSVYGALLADFFAQNAGRSGVAKETVEMWAIYCGDLALATLLTLVLGGWAKVADFGGGAKGGFAVGLLLTSGVGLTLYGTSHLMNLTATMADIGINAVRMALVGGLIGWWLGRGR